MMRRLGMVMAVAVAGLVATPARAQSLGEVTATTGIHGTLAKSGSMNAAGTIGSVKNALGKAVATKEGQLAGAGIQVGWGGKGGTGGWASKSAGGGWSTGGGSSGWAMASTSGGWAAGGGTGSGAWASGGWGSGR
jgi:hypothetical protein